jgi:hypothetical protein
MMLMRELCVAVAYYGGAEGCSSRDESLHTNNATVPPMLSQNPKLLYIVQYLVLWIPAVYEIQTSFTIWV